VHITYDITSCLLDTLDMVTLFASRYSIYLGNSGYKYFGKCTVDHSGISWIQKIHLLHTLLEWKCVVVILWN